MARALGTRVRDAGGSPRGAGPRRAALQPRLPPARRWPACWPPAATSSTSASCRRRWSTSPPRRCQVDGLCMITGSHNPADYNGMKIGVGQTTLYGEAIQEILRMVQRGEFASGQGKVTQPRHRHPLPGLRGEEPEAGPPQAQGGHRRRQRHRRDRRAHLRAARRRGGPALPRAGRPLPQPPPRPDRGEEPRAA